MNVWRKLYVLLLVIATSTGVNASNPSASWQPAFPGTPYPQITASNDPAVIAEGDYLVHAVAHCPSCHVPRDRFINADAKSLGSLSLAGGEEWPMGPIGVIRSANITPDPAAGIGAWKDAEIARAIKSAVDREGHSIFFMNGLGYIDDKDVMAIVSYLRTIPAVSEKAKPTEISPAGQKIMASEMQGWLQPRALLPTVYVARGQRGITRGAYLANGPARCIHCHSDLADSPRVVLKGPAFAGSLWAEKDRDNPAMEVNAPNLTPSKKYGHIYGWTEQVFIARFHAGRGIKSSNMPWEDFRLMTDDDLSSIYQYLKSLSPVDRDPGPTYRAAGWKPANPK